MTTLRHEIETTATDADAWAINDICAGVRADHPDAMIDVNSDRMFLRIRARRNGAALRDLIVALDQASFLD
ncbi:hypothetical protein KY389_08805 [Paracoccus bogoriensis]|uniref:hypothetical protein n=1 Tax=Paracoccus bogoriensis TaxID=242065 RepID=UPI001CA4A608|nr:hypothetical protein [Paracoccus bogoriensis]MBW7056793.1 hypothetical protein [Paracoccus bogoriensis]